MLCPYSNMFGKVGEGVHSYRLFHIAIIDVMVTVMGAYIIHLFYPSYSFLFILALLFLTGIILHRLFCVRTTIDKLLFPSIS